jgi:hypothetical protein
MKATLFFILISVLSVQEERILLTSPAVNYPIRFGYINRINDWSSA